MSWCDPFTTLGIPSSSFHGPGIVPNVNINVGQCSKSRVKWGLCIFETCIILVGTKNMITVKSYYKVILIICNHVLNKCLYWPFSCRLVICLFYTQLPSNEYINWPTQLDQYPIFGRNTLDSKTNTSASRSYRATRSMMLQLGRKANQGSNKGLEATFFGWHCHRCS